MYRDADELAKASSGEGRGMTGWRGVGGKGMLRNWQRPGAGKGRGRRGRRGVGGEMATGRGRLGGGNGDREMGRGGNGEGEMGKGERGRGNREGEKGQEEGGFRRWI